MNDMKVTQESSVMRPTIRAPAGPPGTHPADRRHAAATRPAPRIAVA
jgi:hypothetical protein